MVQRKTNNEVVGEMNIAKAMEREKEETRSKENGRWTMVERKKNNKHQVAGEMMMAAMERKKEETRSKEDGRWTMVQSKKDNKHLVVGEMKIAKVMAVEKEETRSKEDGRWTIVESKKDNKDEVAGEMMMAAMAGETTDKENKIADDLVITRATGEVRIEGIETSTKMKEGVEDPRSDKTAEGDGNRITKTMISRRDGSEVILVRIKKAMSEETGGGVETPVEEEGGKATRSVRTRRGRRKGGTNRSLGGRRETTGEKWITVEGEKRVMETERRKIRRGKIIKKERTTKSRATGGMCGLNFNCEHGSL